VSGAVALVITWLLLSGSGLATSFAFGSARLRERLLERYDAVEALLQAGRKVGGLMPGRRTWLTRRARVVVLVVWLVGSIWLLPNDDRALLNVFSLVIALGVWALIARRDPLGSARLVAFTADREVYVLEADANYRPIAVVARESLDQWEPRGWFSGSYVTIADERLYVPRQPRDQLPWRGPATA
jgi:hypothetical protein